VFFPCHFTVAPIALITSTKFKTSLILGKLEITQGLLLKRVAAKSGPAAFFDPEILTNPFKGGLFSIMNFSGIRYL